MSLSDEAELADNNCRSTAQQLSQAQQQPHPQTSGITPADSSSGFSSKRQRHKGMKRILILGACCLVTLASCGSVSSFVVPNHGLAGSSISNARRTSLPSSIYHPPNFRTVLEQQRIGEASPFLFSLASTQSNNPAIGATNDPASNTGPMSAAAAAAAAAVTATATTAPGPISAMPTGGMSPRGRPGKDGVPLNPPNKGSGKAPLRGEEEVDLARKMQVRVAYIRVKYLAREALGRDPTHREWADVLGISDRALAEALTAAADAKTTMIRANMRLVMSIVRRYLSRGVQLKDLLQEGMNGLTRAAEKFDPDRGFKFSTYATWWIKQSVMRAVADQSRVVRLPVHVHDLLNQIGRAERELSSQLGRQPTEAEIAARVDIPQRKLQFLRERTQHTLSMDATRPSGGRKSGSGIGDEVRVSDSISDAEPLQDVKADEAYMREQVERLLDSLNPREADVVKMRYGLVDGQQRTLEEIGVAFRVTRERVRQIEARALHKIKQPYRVNHHKLRDNGRGGGSSAGGKGSSQGHSGSHLSISVFGDFVGVVEKGGGLHSGGVLAVEEEVMRGSGGAKQTAVSKNKEGAGSRGKYRKRGVLGARDEEEGLLVGVGARRGRGRGVGAASKMVPSMMSSHNETLAAFP
ncbi:rna polymerase sigma factor [Nannochloropsis gaditana]|uniref:Rna polymerase sigma factor n=1 Tax=Nannochloropsis gaditana TaxID=72520 RepID=W7T805_9STRA|nr:rna polymerase sigma factor [Nannochloropsis gaditana]